MCSLTWPILPAQGGGARKGGGGEPIGGGVGGGGKTIEIEKGRLTEVFETREHFSNKRTHISNKL